MNRSKADIIQNISEALLNGELKKATEIVKSEYPFKIEHRDKRTYTDKEKMKQFMKDGFIDRYSGERLVNPGMLKVLSFYLPEEFPYHPHWKMDQCHVAYWELIPTVDHIKPIAIGGEDSEENWATTSMLHNSIKNNWTLEQMNWKLHDAGSLDSWDGLSGLFIKLVEADASLLNDHYIKKWYRLTLDNE